MSYLNTSMTKRSSEEADNATMHKLIGGVLGGGAGATAGLVGINNIPRLEGLNSKLSDVARTSRKVTALDRTLQELAAEPAKTLADELLRSDARRLRNTLDVVSFENTPKWARSLAKNPKMRNALMLGTLGLGAAAGGTLGATLGVKGGEALA